MGDRANVKVVSGDSTVFLYTHWAGSDLPAILQTSLRRGKSRWDDGQYLARVIFSDMTKGIEKELTGAGISSTVGDGDDRVLVVNVDAQTVSFGNWKMSFEEYAAKKDPTWHD